jgi:hypothetical protein
MLAVPRVPLVIKNAVQDVPLPLTDDTVPPLRVNELVVRPVTGSLNVRDTELLTSCDVCGYVTANLVIVGATTGAAVGATVGGVVGATVGGVVGVTVGGVVGVTTAATTVKLTVLVS